MNFSIRYCSKKKVNIYRHVIKIAQKNNDMFACVYLFKKNKAITANNVIEVEELNANLYDFLMFTRFIFLFYIQHLLLF